MEVTSADASPIICGKGGLPCPLAMEWGVTVPMLQRDTKHTCYMGGDRANAAA